MDLPIEVRGQSPCLSNLVYFEYVGFLTSCVVDFQAYLTCKHTYKDESNLKRLSTVGTDMKPLSIWQRIIWK